MSISKTLFLAALVCALSLLARGKVINKVITLKRGNEWQYLTKFGISIGQGLFQVRARFKRPYIPHGENEPSDKVFKLDLQLFLDTKWGAALEEPTCTAKSEHLIRLEQLEIPGNGEWAIARAGGLRQQTRPYVWFMAASDCNRTFHSSHNDMPPLEFQIHFTGYDDGEFSHEEIGLLTMYTLALFAYMGILGYNVYNYYKDIKRTDRVESPIMVLLIAVGLEFLAILFRWAHLLVYSYDGEGVTACHVFSIIFEVTSQFFLSLLLIMLSWGWSITYADFDEFEVFIPLIIILLVIHVIIAGFTELTSDAYQKYHDYEGIQGILLVVFRLGMFAYFVYGMRDTFQKCRMRAQEFLRPFSIYAGAYLLSFPALLVLSQVFAHYVRLKVMVVGTILTQSAVMCILLRLFIGKTSYTAVSKHGGSILPGGKND